MKTAILFHLLLIDISGLWAADSAAPKKAQKPPRWERKLMVTEVGMTDSEAMTVIVNSVNQAVSKLRTLQVLVIKHPNTKALWYGVQRFPFDSPHLLLIREQLWALEPDGESGGIRAIRLRKLGVSPDLDVGAVKALVQAALPSYNPGTHMFSSQPVVSLLPKEMQLNLDEAIRPENPVTITALGLREGRINVNAANVARPMVLLFSFDWRLVEIRLLGKSVEFNHEESARAYAVWKKALDKEIDETKE